MYVCPYCQHENQDEALICASCRQSLLLEPDSSASTNKLGEDELDLPGALSTGHVFEIREPELEGIEILLRIRGMAEPLVYEVNKRGLILGRADPDRDINPDIDFGPYVDEDCGLSRRHARLVLNTSTSEVEVTDLNSTNGTYINGQRLDNKNHYYLNNGDEVRLGRLIFSFYYRPR